MAEFWRCEITLRKLRVLLENLPDESPTYWHHTDGRPWTMTNRLLWLVVWAITVAAMGSTGMKKGGDVFKGMPKFPWTESNSDKKFGSAKGRSHDEIMAYLDAMGGGSPEN